MTIEWTPEQQARLDDLNRQHTALRMHADEVLKDVRDLTKARDEALSAQLNALHIFVQRHSLSRENDSSLISDKMAALATDLRVLLAPFDTTHKPTVNPLIPLARDLFNELQMAHELISLAKLYMPADAKVHFAQQSEHAGIGTEGAWRHRERKEMLSRASTFFVSEKKQ